MTILVIVYIGLGNCCTDSGNQAAFSATNPSLNASALEVEQAPPPVEVTIEDSDTAVVVDTELITEEEE